MAINKSFSSNSSIPQSRWDQIFNRPKALEGGDWERLVRREFMPKYRRWHEQTTEFSQILETEIKEGVVKSTDDLYTRTEGFKEGYDEGLEGMYDLFIKDEVDSKMDRRSQLMCKIVNHRMRNEKVANDRALLTYGIERLSGKDAELKATDPEDLQKYLLKRGRGKTKRYGSLREYMLSDFSVGADKRYPGQGWRLNLRGDDKEAIFDRPMLEETLYELLGNAYKYGGQDCEVVVQAKREKDNTVFTVEDDGKGVDPDNLEKLFEEGYTTHKRLVNGKESGGYGLCLARTVAEEVMGGSITVESGGVKYNPSTGEKTPSEVTEGTRFTVSVPQTRKA